MTSNKLRFLCFGVLLFSPLALTSCSNKLPELHAPNAFSQVNCPDCVYFETTVWNFKPSSNYGLKSTLDSLKAFFSESPQSRDTRNFVGGPLVVTPEHSRSVVAAFKQYGAVEEIVRFDGVSTPGESMPLLNESSTESYSASYNTKIIDNSSHAAVLSYSISSKNTISGSPIPSVVTETGSVLIRNHGALLDIQPHGDEYVIWLVRVITKTVKS